MYSTVSRPNSQVMTDGIVSISLKKNAELKYIVAVSGNMSTSNHILRTVPGGQLRHALCTKFHI